MKQHRICIVGSGYVGLVTGACMAEIGHQVVCVDSDKNKLALLKRGENPIYEPGLDELLARHRRSGRLRFVGSIAQGLRSFGTAGDAEVVFIAVGTPPRSNEIGRASCRERVS
jgi:UDPglucose 6-dehydrogenase